MMISAINVLLITAAFGTSANLHYKTWNISSCPVVHESCRPEVVTESKCDYICDETGCNIRVGIVLPSNKSYIVNAEAALVELKSAERAARQLNLLQDNIGVEYRIFDDKCTQSQATIATIDAYSRFCAHVIFGPICDYSLASSARIVKYLGNYGMPLITAGGFSFDFVAQKTSCNDEFFMLINSGIADYLSFSEFLIMILRKYNWRKISLMYQKSDQNEVGGDQSCQLLMKAVIEVKKNAKLDLMHHDGDLEISRLSYEEYLREEVGVSYGIIVICANQTNTRKIIIEAEKLGMTKSGEYLFLTFEMYNKYPTPSQPWYDPSDSKENNLRAKRGYQAVLTFTPLIEAQHAERDEAFPEGPGSAYLDGIYDGLFLFLYSFHRVVGHHAKNVDVNTTLRGIDLVSNMYGQTFIGKRNQEITVNCNGQRVANYALMQMGPEDRLQIIAEYSTMTKTIRFLRSIAWIKGIPPSDIPLCGYDNSNCPIDKWIRNAFFGAAILFVIFIVICCRRYKAEAEIAAMTWKIKPTELEPIIKQPAILSRKSDSLEPLDQIEGGSFTNVRKYNLLEVAVKEIKNQNHHHHKMAFKRAELKELKLMKDLNHPHLAKVFGVCVDPHYLIVTEYCPKGSLYDVLRNKELQMDMMLQLSLVWDIVQGMHFLHCDLKIVHGALKSTNCLLDNHFAVKITDFGLNFLRKNGHTVQEKEHFQQGLSLLWTAPEILRGKTCVDGTLRGDVYSFAVIVHEVFTRKGPFYLSDNKSSQEIVNLVRNGLNPPLRPHIDDGDCEEAVKNLMVQCWQEDENDRPDFATLKMKIKEINSSKGWNNGNLLDNLLSRMEQHANNLEALVQDRTSDYLEEKRKCEELLYQLLPKSVARQLIRRNSVIAETYDQVTIYFSDIAGFTSLSAQSSPLQVVHLLNDLYTCFDKVIEDFNVYKVETIGDAYMVVSGLPERNGDKHACEIAWMSLKLLEKVRQFKIYHRPNEPLKLRIGIHTGPCVAGVVGLKMPRYCLFGDTVNTASRMESTGQPLKIHISSTTRNVLEKFGLFSFECRGEIDIKGKGKMITYWLEGQKNHFVEPNVKHCSKQNISLISQNVLQNYQDSDCEDDRNQRDPASVPLLTVRVD